MTRRASPDELRKAARIGAQQATCARCTRVRQAQDDQQRTIDGRAHRARLTLPGGPADENKQQIHTTANPSAISRPSSATQPNAPADEEAPSDAELLSRHAAGDRDAFGELFRRHRDRLWAVAVRTLADPEEAADALQDAMIAAFRKADGFRGESAVATWLHRIVVNAALDRMRRRAARPTTACKDEDTLDVLATGGRSLADPSESSDTALDVRAALQQLVPEQHAALVLVDMLGYPVTEAAHVLGVSEGTVKSRAARGRARLLPRLKHLRTRSGARARPQNRSPAKRLLPICSEARMNWAVLLTTHYRGQEPAVRHPAPRNGRESWCRTLGWPALEAGATPCKRVQRTFAVGALVTGLA